MRIEQTFLTLCLLLGFVQAAHSEHEEVAEQPQAEQRTWGTAGINAYARGTKMAPNGVLYEPLFDLDLLLNISLTSDRCLYLYTEGRFWGQKSDPEGGITNARQGRFDFSKRQFDLDLGLAWNYHGPWEGRVFVYSDNNLNRGFDLVRPRGYNDGAALENRYYLPSTNFDKGLYRYLSLGTYFTKDLVGADGQLFKPSVFLAGSLALDVIPQRLYGYWDFHFLTRRPLQPKLLLNDLGVAWRPFDRIPDLEFRLGADTFWDIQERHDRTLFYGSVRIVW